MKFLHTADWQIGMKAAHVGKAGSAVRYVRFVAVRKLVEEAQRRGAEFLLLAGDTFEDNGVDRVFVRKVIDILASFGGPVYVIPGNHDPFVPGCVWEHPAWKESENVRILLKPEPVEISGGLLFPCPVTEKHSTKDPTAWIRAESGDGVRIGLAHGTVEAIHRDEPEYPIARDAVQRAGLDYLALGHWHSTVLYKDSSGVVRMAYSGTPEATGFGEPTSGRCLLVEIAGPGEVPRIEEVPTGCLTWLDMDEEIRERGDVARVRDRFGARRESRRDFGFPFLAGRARSGGARRARDDPRDSGGSLSLRSYPRRRPLPSAGRRALDRRHAVRVSSGGSATAAGLECGGQARAAPAPGIFSGVRGEGLEDPVQSVQGGCKMILRSIRVEGWRCFANPMDLGPLADEINVVHAPNATGKSSLLSALVRGLFDNHRVTGKEVESLRPWGRALAPSVTLVFEHGGASYRLAKRFLDQPFSRLERRDGAKYIRVAENEKADDYVRGMLSAQPPGRGMARTAHWGLGQVLYVPQGQLAFSGVPGDLASLIRESLGHQLSGQEATPIERKVEDLYLRFFTEKGRLRSGKGVPAFVEKQAEAEKLREQKKVLLEEARTFEEASRQVQDLAARRNQAKKEAEAVARTLEEATNRAREYADLLNRKETLEARVSDAQARHNDLRRRMDEIRKSRRDLEETKKELTRLREDVRTQDCEVEGLRVQAQETRSRLEEIRSDRAEVEKRWREVERAQKFEQARAKLAETRDLLSRIDEARTDLETKRRKLAEIMAPDRSDLAKIRKAIKERDDAQVHLEAALITVEVVPEKPVSIEILAGENPGEKELSAGDRMEIKGAPEVAVAIRGVAKLRARGPAGSVGELREAVRRAEGKLEELTAGFGSASIEDLETLCDEWTKAKNEMETARARLETLLGHQTREEIEQEALKADREAGAILAERPAWAGNPPDSEVLKAEARKIEDAFKARIDEAEIARDRIQKAYTEACEKQAELKSELKAAERKERELDGRLAELEQDGRSDEERAKKADEIALEWEAARISLKEVQERLGTFEGDPRLEVEKLEKQYKSFQKTAEEYMEKQKEAEGRVAAISARGSYSKLAEVEERLAELERDVEAERLHAEAVNLLYRTVAACRCEVMAAVSGPVEASAARILRRIAGPRMGSLKLGESFEVAAVVPSGLDEAVSTEELSGGEREQVHLAVRLALADLLAGNGRQLVVLDDVLTATDAGRFARILTVLDEYAQRLQILILTCHPERYSGLAGARFFDLVELAA